MKVKAVYEFDVDINDIDSMFVNKKGLAKDLTKAEVKSLIEKNELTADDFNYEIVNEKQSVSFEIEHYNGDTYMSFVVNMNNGNVEITNTRNCSEADVDWDYIFHTDNDLIRIQADNPIAEITYDEIWDCYHNNEEE